MRNGSCSAWCTTSKNCRITPISGNARRKRRKSAESARFTGPKGRKILQRQEEAKLSGAKKAKPQAKNVLGVRGWLRKKG
jgi:hypothetical protein